MLTDDQRAELTMMMRVVSFLQDSQHLLGENPEMMEAFGQLKIALGAILDDISEEERDEILEQYKEEAAFLGISETEE